jgi:hypothetical protein
MNHKIGPRCASDGSQFWDPVKLTCYNVTCGFLYNNVGGRCVFRNISKTLLKESNRECFKISINPWELRRVNPAAEEILGREFANKKTR